MAKQNTPRTKTGEAGCSIFATDKEGHLTPFLTKEASATVKAPASESKPDEEDLRPLALLDESQIPQAVATVVDGQMASQPELWEKRIVAETIIEVATPRCEDAEKEIADIKEEAGTHNLLTYRAIVGDGERINLLPASLSIFFAAALPYYLYVEVGNGMLTAINSSIDWGEDIITQELRAWKMVLPMVLTMFGGLEILDWYSGVFARRLLRLTVGTIAVLSAAALFVTWGFLAGGNSQPPDLFSDTPPEAPSEIPMQIFFVLTLFCSSMGAFIISVFLSTSIFHSRSREFSRSPIGHSAKNIIREIREDWTYWKELLVEAEDILTVEEKTRARLLTQSEGIVATLRDLSKRNEKISADEKTNAQERSILTERMRMANGIARGVFNEKP